MNKKFYVPFDTAKLLKEKGYPQGDSDMYYNPNGELMTNRELIVGYKIDYPIMVERYYFAAPIYCEVLDWLESENKIYINVGKSVESKWCYSVWVEGESNAIISTKFPTQKQAINEAIIKALEEVI